MVELPKRIDPCPIVESVLEIRFSSSLPEDAIFGVIYNQFKDVHPKFESLNVLQLPQAIRDQDPNLRYSPHYKTQKDNFVLQVGPRSFSISNVENYVGWEIFSKKIFSTFDLINNSGVIDKIERLGLRYINILKGVNIFENSNFNISLKKEAINTKTNITTEIPFEKGFCQLRLTSDAEAQLGGPKGELVLGSVIDIDAVVNAKDFQSISQAIEYSHQIEKELFFTILKEDFIKTLNPEY